MRVESFAIFSYVLVCGTYPWKVPVVVGNIVIVGVLTCCALVHSVIWDLKAIQINMQHGLIRELMLHKFEQSHNTAEATENIYCAKGQGAVDHTTVTRWFKKFHLGCKNLNNQSDKPKAVDYECASSPRGKSGE